VRYFEAESRIKRNFKTKIKLSMNCKYCNKPLIPSLSYCINCNESKITPTKYKFYLIKCKIYFSNLNNALKTYRNKHKYTPTAETPIFLKNIKFYSDYFLYKNTKISYRDVYGIKHKFSKKYMNGIRTDNDLSFYFYFQSKAFDYKTIEVNLSVVNEILVWRKRETTSILLYWMLDKTFQNRLNNYISEIKEIGYLVYNGEKIYNNGDLHHNDKFAVNLIEEKEKGNIWYGVSLNSIFGQNRGQNPYLFRIKNGVQKPRLFEKRNIDINIEYNKDVFDLIIQGIFKNGYIIEV
jgi:hypothetical protein